MNFLLHKKLLISTFTIFTSFINNYAIGSSFEGPEKTVKQRRLSSISAEENIYQAFNEHREGEGGTDYDAYTETPISPHTEMKKRPGKHYYLEEDIINKINPRELFEIIRFAANAKPPHAMACVLCAEYYQELGSSEDAQNYYERSLLVSNFKPAKVCRELMKIHYNVAIQSRRAKIKKNTLKKAMEFANQISRRTEDDEIMLEDIETKLSQIDSETGGGVIVPRVKTEAVILTEKPSEALETLGLSEKSLRKLLPENGSNAGLSASAGIAEIKVEHLLSYPVPDAARGHEEIYYRFLNGVLIYKPNKDSDKGKREFPILDFLLCGQNPLESTFDLTECGNADNYLRISTGYRRTETKLISPPHIWEVFITPKFLIEHNKKKSSSHYRGILEKWTSSFAIIQNDSSWLDLGRYWYNTTSTDQEINEQNFCEIYESEKSCLRPITDQEKQVYKHHLILSAISIII